MSLTESSLPPLAIEAVLGGPPPKPPKEEFSGRYDADRHKPQFSWSSCGALSVALLVAMGIVFVVGTFNSAVLVGLHLAFLAAAFVLVDSIAYNYFVYLLDRYAEVEDWVAVVKGDPKARREPDDVLPDFFFRLRRPEEYGQPLTPRAYRDFRNREWRSNLGVESTRLQLFLRRFHTYQLLQFAREAAPNTVDCELPRRLAYYPFRLLGTLLLLSGPLAGAGLSLVLHGAPLSLPQDFGFLALIWMFAFPLSLTYKHNFDRTKSFLRALNAFLDAKDDKIYSPPVRYALFTIGLTVMALGIFPPVGMAPVNEVLALCGLAAAFIYSASPWIAMAERQYNRELTLAENLWKYKYRKQEEDEEAAKLARPWEQTKPLQRADFSCDWEYYVSVMQASPNLKEREYLWLGTHEDNPKKPVIIHRKGIQEHVYMCGSSGIAKTSLGIAPLCMQLIRHRNYDEAGRDLGPHAGIVIIDLKGDPALFETMRLEAEKAGRTFKFFTSEFNQTTYAYNPLKGKLNGTLNPGMVVENLMEALNLNHGEGYGRSFFTREMRALLQTVFSQKRTPPIGSLADLAAVLDALPRTKDHENVKELLNVVKSLSRVDPLNVTQVSDPEAFRNAIYMPEVVREKQIVYFWLPVAAGSATAREIAKLALYDLYTTAAAMRKEAHQMYLVIDEFQQIVSRNLEPILQQARSAHVGTILANQSPQNLKNQDVDLRPTIKTNTHLQQVFSANTTDDQDDVIKLSGESIRYMKATSTSKSASRQTGTSNNEGHVFGPQPHDTTGKGTTQTEGTATGESETLRPEIRPRFTVDDINRISADPTLSIVRISRNDGYAQHDGRSQVIRMLYAMPKSEYDVRSAAPWPALAPVTMHNTYRMDEAPDADAEPARPATRKTTVRNAAKKAGPDSAAASAPSSSEPFPNSPVPNSPEAAPIVETPPVAETTPVAQTSAAEPANPPPVTVPRQSKARPLEGADLDQALSELSQQTQAPPPGRRKRKRDSEDSG